MAELVTLDRFVAREAGYHLALLHSSAMDSQPHYHEYYQVCYMLSGQLIHQQEGRSVPAHPAE